MKESRKRSSIWIHFHILSTIKAECKICNKKLAYRGGSTNNLHRHMRSVHPTVKIDEKRQASGHVILPAAEPEVCASTSGMEVLEAIASVAAPSEATALEAAASEAAASEAAASEAAASATPHELTNPQPVATTQSSIMQLMVHESMTPLMQATVDEELVAMIARDFQPFSIVEDKGFRKYTYYLNPMYNIPSKKTIIQTVLPRLYDRERAKLQDRITRVTAVCLTVDCWTSSTTTAFISVTCHFIENYKKVSCLLDCFEFSERHTSENLAVELLRVVKEWHIEGKVICCVSDDAANITNAIKLLNWTHHSCLAHTINLIVRDALKVIKPTLDKVKSIVEFFHKNTIATEKLKSTQRQMGMPELRLKQDCVTQWNSTYHMLKRVLESKNAVILTLAIVCAPVDTLNQEEWEVVRETCTVLEPFEQVIVEISAESYATSSKMLVLCRGLQTMTTHHQTEGAVTTLKAAELVTALCASMNIKFHRMEYNTLLSETTILDPRYKKLAFDDAQAVDEALKRITSAARCYNIIRPGDQGREAKATSSVWRLFDERATGETAGRNPSADARIEVRGYGEEPIIQRSADPLTWWEAKTSIYPRLAKVMAERLCIVATSVPSERVFSKTGQIITERRNRISSEKMKHLVFLNANLP
ncbi:zinc finger BED domain-containing protein 4-like [Dendrobates tinctorius]|uniref:zinc finger BED domain-containing protein 4-like n=1 Tax=Dendrobates tinctorius TaxID=92724 RepID=UPI003CC99EF9